MRLANTADLTYSLGGKFRVNNLFDQNFAKVCEKNHTFLQLNLPEPGFGLKNLSSMISCKNQYQKMFWENSVYYNLSNLCKGSKMQLGVYTCNRVHLDNGRLRLGAIKQL